MTAAQVLANFMHRGFQLSPHGAELHVTPGTLLDAADRTALVAHKPALLALLANLEELERDGTAARLRAIAATLTPEEHERLRAEAAAGDRLAELMVAVLAPPPERVEVLRCRCGGIAWEPDPSGVRERCAACGTWSPCSVVVPEVSSACP
jgi:hypothetical protein